MKKYTVIFYSLFLCFFFSCKNQGKLAEEKLKNKSLVKNCQNSTSIYRSELDLFEKKYENHDSIFKKINQEYPNLFDVDILKNAVQDSDYNIIFDSVYVFFKEEVLFFDILNSGFCVFENYFETSKPRAITAIDADIIEDKWTPFNSIFYDPKENLILIQLQWFLGKDHVFYTDRRQPIPEYLTERYHEKYIPSMVFSKIGEYYTAYNNQNNQLLTVMINEAKPYFFTELMLPQLKDNLIFGSTQDDIDYFNQNAESLWRYILENQFLFSSESTLKEHFITPSKSTQLGTPGRFGVWIGWQILRSYFNNNNVTLQEILKETNYLEILNKSNYKP